MQDNLILLTNDDGINSDGIKALYKHFRKIFKILVIAPINQKSGVGCGLTLSKEIEVIKYKDKDIEGYAVNGTPVDCIKIALNSLLSKPPKFVISGINQGRNTGFNIFYSGTVAGALEAALNNINSISVSLNSYTSKNFEFAAIFTSILVKTIINSNLREKVTLNVNIPAVEIEKIKGIKITKQGLGHFRDRYVTEERDSKFLIMRQVEENYIMSPEDEDDYFLNQNYITITPLKLTLTDYNQFNEVKKLISPILESENINKLLTNQINFIKSSEFD